MCFHAVDTPIRIAIRFQQLGSRLTGRLNGVQSYEELHIFLLYTKREEEGGLANRLGSRPLSVSPLAHSHFGLVLMQRSSIHQADT